MSVERISVATDPPVRGILHPAASSGADGNADAPLLVAVAEAFAARGVTDRARRRLAMGRLADGPGGTADRNAGRRGS